MKVSDHKIYVEKLRTVIKTHDDGKSIDITNLIDVVHIVRNLDADIKSRFYKGEIDFWSAMREQLDRGQ